MGIPNVYDLILLLISGTDNKFNGKTNIHKNLFLIKEMMLNERIELPIRFKPYYYGPFSSDISNALDLLVCSGLVDWYEKYYNTDSSSDIKQSIFELSKQGEEMVESIKDNNLEFNNAFSKCLNSIKETGYQQNTSVLATAAKIRFILKRNNVPLNKDSIDEKAHELGWDLKTSDYSNAKQVLESINLLDK